MSNAVLSIPVGFKLEAEKIPIWSTRRSRSVSALERRVSEQVYPMYEINLSVEVLRDGTFFGAPLTEARDLLGFFNNRAGSLDSFLYTDPDDNTVAAHQFGTGDAVTTAFQLLRTYGGFPEPAQNLNGAPQIFRNDWQGNQLMFSALRTNLTLQSEAFDNAAWTKSGSTVTPNSVAAPDGNVTADAILDTAANVLHQVSQNVAKATANLPYTFSIYAKFGTQPTLYIELANAASSAGYGRSFNIQTGAMGAAGSFGAGFVAGVDSITPLPNGWFRCTVSATSDVDATIKVTVRGTTAAYLGTAAIMFHLFGGQLEPALVAGSYIPTVAAAVSRADYALDIAGLVTFAVAPLAAALLTWTGSYYWRVIFNEDRLTFRKMYTSLWELRKLPLYGSVMNKV